jgi:predicted  nucleic acid-binding Zn-ribbon protein
MDGDVEIAIALKRKILQLMELYEKEKKISSSLTETIAELNGQIKGLETEIDSLKKSNRRLKLSTAFKSKAANQSTNEDDALGAKKIIDELVREIDRCVALLNR